MYFDGRKSKNIASSTGSTGNRPGDSTLNDIMAASTPLSEFSTSFVRRELNSYLPDNGDPEIGDSTQFVPLSYMGSVQGQPEPPISDVERIDLRSDNPDPSILSTKDLEPIHKDQDATPSDLENSGRIKITRNEKTGSYHIKVKYK